ncbi:hypothetical protein PPACK8108_LOCUS9556 [Phakopsora pachyrhizi]|uniref:Uncharacterized protein n=1 Tax=Phakopsora pachyrhizi TaxID=170000 RepID=A0AAV0B010_PHAPC|nr:hypothetical protein PPACK8108_LOCUS9556 [Phakopsora pachyrhizi]
MISFCTFFNFFVLIRGLICSFIKSIVSKVSLKTDKQEAGDVKECIGTNVVDLEKGAKILTRKDLEDLIFGSEATIFRSASTIRAEEKDENFRISSERGIPEISSQPMVRTFSSLRPWSISQLIHSESFNEINNYNSQKFILFKNPEGANENTRETGFNPRCFKVKETKAMVENLELEDKVEALRQRLMSDVSSNSAGSFIAQSQSSPSVCRIPSMESVIDPMFFHLPSLPRAVSPKTYS